MGDEQPKTDRYRRKKRKDGTDVFVKKKSVFEVVSSLTADAKNEVLFADEVIVPLPKELRDRSAHAMPVDIAVRIGESDEMLDRAYKRLRGLNGKKLQSLVIRLINKLIEVEYEENLQKTPEQLLRYLDKQLHLLGMQVLGAQTWQKRYGRRDPVRRV